MQNILRINFYTKSFFHLKMYRVLAPFFFTFIISINSLLLFYLRIEESLDIRHIT